MAVNSRKRRSLGVAASGAALAALLTAGPAWADGNMWNSMLGWVGLGHKQNSLDNGTIDYRPQPMLVVPPKMDLPPPQQATAKPADWPHDPDALARVRAQADSRRPAPSSDTSQDATDDSFVADADKSKPQDNGNGVSAECSNAAGKPICFYGPTQLLNFTKGWNFFSSKGEDTHKLKVGVAPPRQYLIQPPSQYEMPKVKGEDDDADEDSADTADTDTSKYDKVDVGAPRHHHQSAANSDN